MTDNDAFDAALKILWAQDNPQLTKVEIARRLGCRELTIHRAVRRLGLPLRSRQKKVYDVSLCERMLREGETYKDIAKAAGVSPSSVRRLAVKLGLDKSEIRLQKAAVIPSAKRDAEPEHKPKPIKIPAGLGPRERKEEIYRLCLEFSVKRDRMKSRMDAGFQQAPAH